MYEDEDEGFAESTLDPRSITPVERARRKKKTKLTLPEPTNVKKVGFLFVKHPKFAVL